MHRSPKTLVSGAEGAASFAQLPTGALVADEFGKLLGIVAGPFISPDPSNYAADADALLVIVDVDSAHPTHKHFAGGQVCISGRFLHPLEHGPLLDDDPEPSFKPGADAEAWHVAWNAWYARRQDLDAARHGEAPWRRLEVSAATVDLPGWREAHATCDHFEGVCVRGDASYVPAPARTSAMRRALELVLALHDHPEAAPAGYGVKLDPMAEAQLRAALDEPSPLDDLNPHRLHPPTQWLREQTTYDEDANVYYEPIVVDGRVGYRVAGLDARETYVYFNPSTGGGGDPDHTPNVFVYLGEECDPAVDDTDCSITITF